MSKRKTTKYNVQFCPDTSPGVPPGISVGLFNTEDEAKAAVQAIEESFKYMRLPIVGHSNPITWIEMEDDE